MADHDSTRGYPGPMDAPSPPPAHGLAQMLEARLSEACERLAMARREIEEWEPVKESCEAGLRALSKAQEAQEMPQVAVGARF